MNNKVQDKSKPAVGKEKNGTGPVAEYVVIPPDGGWGWVVVAAAFFCQTVVDGILLTFGTYLHDIADTYNQDNTTVSLVGSLMFGIHLAAGPICAAMTHCMLIRSIVMTGGFMMAVSMAAPQLFLTATGQPPSFWLLAVIFGFLAGTGMCLVFMGTIMVTSAHFSRKRLIALGLVVCSTGAGTVIFVFAGSSMLKTMSWETAHLVLSGLSLLIVPAALVFRPLKPARIETRTDMELEDVQSRVSLSSLTDMEDLQDREDRMTVVMLMRSRDTSRMSGMDAADIALDEVMSLFAVVDRSGSRGCRCCSLCRCGGRERVALMHPSTRDLLMEQPTTSRATGRRGRLFAHRLPQLNWRGTLKNLVDCRILSNARYRLFCLSGCFSASGLIIVFTFENKLGMEHGYTESDATALVASLGASNMIWRILVGWTSTSRFVNYHVFHVVGMLLGGFFMIATTFSPAIEFQFFCCILQGLGFACFAVFRPVLLLDIVGVEKMTNATGLALMMMGLASIGAPPLAGAMETWTGDVRAVPWCAGASFLVAGLLLIPTHDKTLGHLRRRWRGPPTNQV